MNTDSLNQLKKMPSFEDGLLGSFEIPFVDHLGRRLNLVHDLVSRRRVWLHLFSLQHPQLQSDLATIADLISEQEGELGKDFSICSISMDPTRDYTDQLYQLARDQELIVPGWHFTVLSAPHTQQLLEQFCAAPLDEETPRLFLLQMLSGLVSATAWSMSLVSCKANRIVGEASVEQEVQQGAGA